MDKEKYLHGQVLRSLRKIKSCLSRIDDNMGSVEEFLGNLRYLQTQFGMIENHADNAIDGIGAYIKKVNEQPPTLLDEL